MCRGRRARRATRRAPRARCTAPPRAADARSGRRPRSSRLLRPTPPPRTATTSREAAGRTRIGAMPPKLAMSACTTLDARPAATPASTALPPRRSPSVATSATSGCPATTPSGPPATWGGRIRGAGRRQARRLRSCPRARHPWPLGDACVSLLLRQPGRPDQNRRRTTMNRMYRSTRWMSEAMNGLPLGE
jgi:hypothetical protein